MLVRILTEGFALGASTGVVCFGSCAPFLVPYLMTGTKIKPGENIPLLLQFFLGRFLAYVLFGVLTGWLGAEIRTHLSQSLRAGTTILAAALMILFAFQRSFPKNPFCKLKITNRVVLHSPFLMGFLLGLNLCPPFLVGMARLVEIGTALTGAFFFAAFFVSSSFYLLPLFFVVPYLAGERLRSIGLIASVLVGIYYLGLGLLSFF
jgi:sulfite exporter TauE/SafE